MPLLDLRGSPPRRPATPAPGRGAVHRRRRSAGWWFKSSPTPTPIITDGVYGQPNTNVLLGGGDMDTNPNPGFPPVGRLRDGQALGLEGNFLYIASRSTSRSVSSSGSDGSTDLLLPYFEYTESRKRHRDLLRAALCRQRDDRVEQRLMGAEANATYALDSAAAMGRAPRGRIPLAAVEGDVHDHHQQPVHPAEPGRTSGKPRDKFAATNNFYGAQFGAQARYDADRWFASGILKVGLGAMVQSVDVSGSLLTNDFNRLRRDADVSRRLFRLAQQHRRAQPHGVRGRARGATQRRLPVHPISLAVPRLQLPVREQRRPAGQSGQSEHQHHAEHVVHRRSAPDLCKARPSHRSPSTARTSGRKASAWVWASGFRTTKRLRLALAESLPSTPFMNGSSGG